MVIYISINDQARREQYTQLSPSAGYTFHGKRDNILDAPDEPFLRVFLFPRWYFPRREHGAAKSTC